MSVLDSGDAGSYFDVITESGSQYGVDVDLGACTCPDYQHNDDVSACKHLRRVEIILGDRDLPPAIDEDGVDPQLGEHVDGAGGSIGAATEPAIATDGGMIDADEDSIVAKGDDGTEILEDDGDPWKGPFAEHDKYGELTGERFYRCRDCGTEVHEESGRDRVQHRDGCRFSSEGER